MTSIVTANAGAAYLGGLFGAFERSQSRVATGKFVFSAADDVTRYTMSERMLSRTRQIDRINNTIAVTLGKLEATSRSLKELISLAEQGLELAREAQTKPPVFYRGVTPEVHITRDSVVNTVIGARLSITSDTGQNFLFTFNRPNITWGEVAAALNSANIGVNAEFVPGYAVGEQFLRIFSISNRDFRFDGISDETVMDDLAGPAFISPATMQVISTPVQAAGFFGAAGVTTGTETGFTVAYGGTRIGTTVVTGATAISAGSMLVMNDASGAMRTFSYPAGATLAQVVNEINAQSIGVVAELVNHGTGTLAFRMRNTMGGPLTIHSATGAFTTTGALGFAPATSALNVQPTRNIGVAGNSIVTNGSFEAGALGIGNVPTGWTYLGGGTIVIDNTPGRVNNGLQYVALGGSGTIPGAALRQNIATVPGVEYTFTIDIGTNWGFNTRSGSLRIEILDGGTPLVDQVLTPGALNGPYQSIAYQFTAPSATTTIRLTDVSAPVPGDNDVDIDNVRVYAVGIDAGDNAPRLALGHQYESLKSTMSRIIANNGGTPDSNLLAGHNLLLNLDEFDKSKLLITGTALNVTGSLGLAQNGAGWYTDGNIQASVVQLTRAITTLRAQEYRIASFAGHIKERMDILEAAGHDFKVNGDDLVGVSMEEEGALMAAYRTRIDFASQSLVAANQSQQGLLRLLG